MMITSFIGIVVGVGLIGFSIWRYIDGMNLVRNRLEVEATVIKTRRRRDFEDGDTYYPVFEYSINGNVYEKEYVTTESKYTVGSSTIVYCDENNPNNSVLPEQVLKNKIACFLLFPLGVFLLCYAFFTLVR